MRNISFDESTVLNEFARIANEKGLLKTAQDATEQVSFSEEDAGTIVPAAPDASKIFKAFMGEAAQNPLTKWISLDPALSGSNVGSGHKMSEVSKLVSGQVELQLGKYPQQAPVVAAARALVQKYFPQAAAKKAKLDVDLSKEAGGESKLYDVSGETGEQLVEEAHPGGGTRTELTHSKTDENLVETIVEQQKRDVEVATRVPKGTYAMLVGLYSKLQKMGHEKYLSVLSSAINKVATNEEVVSYVLTSLADNLDTIGAKNAANRVDKIISLSFMPGLVGPASQFLGGTLPALRSIMKDLQNFDGTLDNLIGRFRNLDPKDSQTGQHINEWIARLTQGKQSLSFLPTTTDPKVRATGMEKKKSQVTDLANYIDQMVIGWPKVKNNLSDWGLDPQQAEKTLWATQKYVRNQANQITKKLMDAQSKMVAKQAPTDPNEPALVSKPVAQPEIKKWDPLNNLRHANILRRRFNKAIRDLPEHHDDAVPNFREEDTGKYPNQLRSEIQRARKMVRDSGGWAELEKTMDDKRSVAGKGQVKPAAEGDVVVGDKSQDDVARYNAKLNATAKKMVQYGWRKLEDWTGLPKAQISIQDAKLYQKEILNSAFEVLREAAPYGPGVEVLQFSGESGRGLAEELKTKLVKKYKQ